MTIARSIRAVNRALLGVASMGVLLIAITVFSGVVTRYVLGAPLAFIMPTSEYLLLGIVFLALAGALQNGAHVRIDFVTDLMPKRAALIFRQFGDAIGVIVSGLMCWLSARQFAKVLHSGETDISVLRIPLWGGAVAAHRRFRASRDHLPPDLDTYVARGSRISAGRQ